MARSLFEAAPEPLSSRFWRKMKHLHIGPPSGPARVERPDVHETNDASGQAESLDARGRQLFLQAALAATPIRRR
jgi:hypothetical protein